jgi:hypothetical protein
MVFLSLDKEITTLVIYFQVHLVLDTQHLSQLDRVQYMLMENNVGVLAILLVRKLLLAHLTFSQAAK